MATNKNQHFVPRCHLRPFTVNSGNAAINVFNLDRKTLIPNAPVKNQCSKDYFYGTDETLERAIQLIESGYGRALSDLLSNNRSLTDDNKTIFRMFWIFQHLRTEAAAKRAVAMIDVFRDAAEVSAEEFSFGIKEAVQMACQNFAGSMHELDDLKFCIFKNKSKVPFITSDNPAVLTNKWQLDRKQTSGLSFGIGSAGMMALLPLTPRLLLIGYDGDVYSVPNVNGIVDIKNDRDAIALNRHQFLQCAANVYTHDAAHKDALAKHYSEIENTRPKSRHIVHYAQFDCNIGQHTRYAVVSKDEMDKTKQALIHQQTIHPHPGIWPSQIQIRRNGAVYTNGSGMGYVRLSHAHSPYTPFRKERPLP
ncbi:TPA: DUF4238 domain-containing protein [Burkholderia stabilis]|nr:DUF4238 domain-containing protein [Burkholderia stabilis]HDR9648656.1 DUF4238 domain-containing protein [Burkholderia stabilis]HDR9654510.1 DUF4238 domain-containing protein [Burkholderia stabilis]HDR9678376.1 DUF4238 domain-containing protein [Burkholderia stabilis]